MKDKVAREVITNLAGRLGYWANFGCREREAKLDVGISGQDVDARITRLENKLNLLLDHVGATIYEPQCPKLAIKNVDRDKPNKS